jgi:hypothetical protein
MTVLSTGPRSGPVGSIEENLFIVGQTYGWDHYEAVTGRKSVSSRCETQWKNLDAYFESQ